MNGCLNRPPLVEHRMCQDGWNVDGTRHMEMVRTRLTDECCYTHSELGQKDSGCVGCRHRVESVL